MRRTLWTCVGVLAVGCGIELSVAPSDGAAQDAGGSGTSSGGVASSSSGQSTSGDPDAEGGTSGELDADVASDGDAPQCQSLIELNGKFCGSDGVTCTQAVNESDSVKLPDGTMTVSVEGCSGTSAINGGNVQIDSVLPASFRVKTHFFIDKSKAPIVVLLFGAKAPTSIDQDACTSLQAGDVAVALYREAIEGGPAQWKLEAKTQAACQLPSDSSVLDPAPEKTEFAIEVLYDDATLTAQGTWTEGATTTVFPASGLEVASLATDARLAFAAFTLDDEGSSKNSVHIDKLHVLCP